MCEPDISPLPFLMWPQGPKLCVGVRVSPTTFFMLQESCGPAMPSSRGTRAREHPEPTSHARDPRMGVVSCRRVTNEVEILVVPVV